MKKTIFMVEAGIIAALYVLLMIIFQPISFGPLQLRVAEMLTILPYFTPAAIPGLFIGCLLSNIQGAAPMPDIIFGSFATLIGAVGSYYVRKNKFMVPFPPILANVIILPLVFKFAYKVNLPLYTMAIYMAGSEFIGIGILGMVLLYALLPIKKHIFVSERY